MTSPVFHRGQKEVHVLVCGIGGSGKRNLCTRFATDTYSENYDPTCDFSYRKQHTVDSTGYLISIDTAHGPDANSAVFQHQCRNANAFILVYSITSQDSITELRSVHAAITEHQQTEVSKPTFLVGTKVDLEPQREVSLSEARSLAIELNCRKWFEVSAKEQVDEINDLFTKLVRETQRGEIQPTSTNSTAGAVEAQSNSQATPQRTRTNGTTTSLTPSQKGALSPDSQPQSPPSSSPRGGSMLERFKFGSLKRKPSIQSLVRKKSGSFSASIMSFGTGEGRASKEQTLVSSGVAKNGNGNGPPYRLDVDTSAWGSVKWPAEIIPE